MGFWNRKLTIRLPSFQHPTNFYLKLNLKAKFFRKIPLFYFYVADIQLKLFTDLHIVWIQFLP